MKLLIVCVLLWSCSGVLYIVHAEEGRKISFDTSIGLNEDDVQYNDDEEPAVGSEEYYDDYRWVSVTSEGYETEGTLEEAKAMLADMMDEEEEEEPATSPPHPKEDSEPATLPHFEEEDDDEESDPATSPPHFEQDISYETEKRKRQTTSNEEEDDNDDDLTKELTAEDNIGQEDTKDEFKKVTGQRVFGIDTRVRVRNPNRYPFRAMGRIKRGCSGTLIGRRVVLTAAHCLYQRGQGWNRNLDFQRKKNCCPDKGVNMVWRRAVTYRAWIRRSKPRFDIGIILLYRSSPTWMSMSVIPRRYLKQSIINIAGYPGDKPGRCLWITHCRNRKLTLYGILKYRCDTFGGMSGSAVYHYYPRTGRRTIVGVHAFGSSRYNGGSSITHAHRRNIRSWIRSYRCRG